MKHISFFLTLVSLPFVASSQVVPSAPTDFLASVFTDQGTQYVFPNAYYPTTDTDGNPLASDVELTMKLYDGDDEIYQLNGIPGNMFSCLAPYDGQWTNGVKLLRVTASLDGVEGPAATFVMHQDGASYISNHRYARVAGFSFASDEPWTATGSWQLTDGLATTTGDGTLTSPDVQFEADNLYLVRYYVNTDADAGADFTVTVGDDQQVFTNARIGLNTNDSNIRDPQSHYYVVGKYQFIDFPLTRTPADCTANVEIAASNVGTTMSVDSVIVYAVREYPEICTVPYENDFDDTAIWAPGHQTSWEENWSIPFWTVNWRIDEMSRYDAQAVSGTRAMVAPPTAGYGLSSTLDYIYTPYLQFEAGKSYTVEFDYYMPSETTGLSFVYAYEPTYTEGEYAIIEDFEQATKWTHYTSTEITPESDGTLVFGFVAYSEGDRDLVIAIDNLQVLESNGSSVSEIGLAQGKVYCYGNLLTVPASTSAVAVYDLQGRCVMSTTATCGEVSVASLAHGVYVVKATDAADRVTTAKIVK